MMVLLDKLLAHLNDILEVENYKDYCPNGLQVEGKKQVRKVATAVTASLQVIKKAIQAKADALVVHHGFFWGSNPEVIRGTFKEKLELLLKHKVSLLAYHLPLDAHTQLGNNWGAFIEMGFEDLQPFGYFSGQPLGVKGRCKKTSINALMNQLTKYYKAKPQLVNGGPQRIQSLGLISGGAHKEIKQAIAEGLDVYLTGTQDEPLWHLAREEKIHFIALGHHNSEKIGPQRLGSYLAEHFKLQTLFIDEANPF